MEVPGWEQVQSQRTAGEAMVLTKGVVPGPDATITVRSHPEGWRSKEQLTVPTDQPLHPLVN